MRGGQGDGEFPPLEAAALGLLGAIAAAAGAVNLVGALAGAAFGDGWTTVSLSEMPRVLSRLPSELSDPAQAWPADARAALPGPAGFAAASAAVVALLALGIACAVAATSRGRADRPRPARWARGRDLRSLRTRRTAAGRVMLGLDRRHLVAAEERQSVLVVAPTQTGKTTGLAIPAILEWQGPVLATSIKSDLVRDTLTRREALGEVKVFDPSAATGLPRASWTPLASCNDWDGARRAADRLAKAAQSAPRSGQDGEFWSQAGARFLAPLLLAAARSGRTIGDVSRWIDAEEHEEVLDVLEATGLEAAKNAAIAVWGADDRLRSSLYLTASLALEAYNDPAVLACSERSDLTSEWLLDGGCNTAYLCAPIDEQARLRPLFTTLIREVIGDLYARSSRTGYPIDPPLLVVLDEAANIAPLPDLDQLASTGAGQGLQLVTVFQDLAQVHQRWPGKADTIVNNHRAKLFGPGITCARTLEYLRRILGDAEVRQRSQTSAERGRRSTTQSSTFRPLAPANHLRERESGSMLLVYGNLPPALVRLRPWFRDGRLRRLVRRGS